MSADFTLEVKESEVEKMKELELLKKPIFWLILTLVLIWVAVFQLPDNRLHLVFCDVGQGDAILVSFRSNQVLIDGGPNNKVLNCLADNMPFWDRTIEVVVLTHPQADHLSGLVEVMKRYDVVQFVVNSIVNDTAGFWQFYQAVLEEKAKIYSPKVGDKIKIGPLNFLVLWPKEKLGDARIWLASQGDTSDGGQKRTNVVHLRGGVAPQSNAADPFDGSPAAHLGGEILGAATYSGNLNETSIVLNLSFGNFDTLLTGDISVKIEKEIIGEFHTEPVEVLKAAHHGSKYSTSKEFLEKVKPKLAIISVGKNPFGHPTDEIIGRLRDYDIKILRTDQEGEIEIVSDGKGWDVKGGKR